MRLGEGKALVAMDDQRRRGERLAEKDVRGVAADRLEDDVPDAWLQLRPPGEVGDTDAGPVRVEHRPLRHAVDVAGLLDLRHGEELGEVDLERLEHVAVHLRLPVPRARVPLPAAHRAEPLQEVLVRREAGPAVGALGVARALLLRFVGADVGRPAESEDERAGGQPAEEDPALHRRNDRPPACIRPLRFGVAFEVVHGLFRESYARRAGSVTVPRRMAARKAGRERDMTARVGEAGFTPSVRDVPAIVALLDAKDEALVRNAERALVRVGPTLVPIVRDEANRASPVARARLVRAVGALVADFAPEQEERRLAVEWLIDELGRSAAAPSGQRGGGKPGEANDARGARYAATALGKLKGDTAPAERALLAAWNRTGPIELRRVLADALGKIGTADAATALRAWKSDDAELTRIVGRALLRIDRTLLRTETSAIDLEASLERPWPVVFRCRAGLESILVDEIGKNHTPRAVEEGRVQAILRGPLSAALVPRTALSFALLLGPETGTDEAKIAGDLLASEPAWRILRTFTRGPIRFRLAFESGGHRRGLVHRLAERLRVERPEVVNDPTASAWEALVREHAEPGEAGRRGARTLAIELEPRALVDDRFAYRVSDVPAASHPTIAAALARVAEARDGDVVWDPFVGSALELIERARLGPYAALHGTDVDESALEAARANLARAGVERVHLAHGDSTDPAGASLGSVPSGVTLVLTNPPMGRRVARGELAPLMDHFIATVARVLAPGGRLVWLSPMPERTRGRLEAEGFTIDVARAIDMGGFVAELQRATKR